MRATRRHAVLAALALGAGGAACASLLGADDVTYSSDGGGDVLSPPDAPRADVAPPFDGGPEGGCGDILKSGDNCGRCGHSCMGGPCVGGVCQPVIVATGELGCAGAGCETKIAADDDAVYWVTYRVKGDAGSDASPGHVARATCDASTCSPTQVLVPDVFNAGALSLAATYVYYALGARTQSTGSILRCQKGGCGGGGSLVCDQGVTVAKTAVHGGSIYWVDGRVPNGGVYSSAIRGRAG